MSYRYRRDRYYKSKISHSSSLAKMAFVIVTLVGCIAFSVVQFKQKSKLHIMLAEKNIEIKQYVAELSILRTLNPYHVAAEEILPEAAANVDLFPGWVARVYPVPSHNTDIGRANDLGSFIMNETRFSLSSHKRYGIVQPNRGMYRLNGLFPSYTKGRLQVGVEFYLADQNMVINDDTSQVGSCYARIDINQKRVIDKKLHVITRFSHEQVLTGEVELGVGLFPISATLYCDEKSDFQGDDVHVSISFRNPGQYNLTTKRNAVFHIYKSDNQNMAKL